jgi:hypothetical protein
MVGSGFRAHLKVPTCSGTRPNKKRGPIFGSHHPSSLESQVVPSSSKIFWRTSSTFTALCTESAHPRSITPLSAWVLYRYFDFKALWRMRCGHPARLEKRDFDFCLSTSIPVLTTSTYVVAWPQGDQLLGGGPWHKANLPATHRLSLPFSTPEGAWPLSPLAPAAVSRWLDTTGAMPGRIEPCYFRRLCQYRCLCVLVFVAQSEGYNRPLGPPTPLPS